MYVGRSSVAMRQGAGYDALCTLFVADVIRILSSAARAAIRLCNFATGHTFLRALDEAMLDVSSSRWSPRRIILGRHYGKTSPFFVRQISFTTRR